MFSKKIEKFTYKDDTKKVSAFINDNYPGIGLEFDKINKSLTITCANEKRLSTVYNILTVVNRMI